MIMNKKLKKTVFQDIKDMVNQFKTDAIYNYDYEYYDVDNQGNLIKTNKFPNKSRQDYEEFSRNPKNNVSFGYSGEVSLRAIYTRGSTEIIGYITEAKRPENNMFTEMNSLYMKAYKELVTILDVKDTKTFNIYMKKYTDYAFSGVNQCINAINDLESFLTRYNNDPQFKKIVDKIKG